MEPIVIRAIQEKTPGIKRNVRTVAILFLGTLVIVGGVVLSKKAAIKHWFSRLGEPDVQTGAYFLSLVAPPKLREKIIEKIKSAAIAVTGPFGAVVDFFAKVIDGNQLYTALELGIDRVGDWKLVQESYHGLSGGSLLLRDMRAKLTQDEFDKLMKRLDERMARRARGEVDNAAGRNAMVAKIYKMLEKATPGKIYTLPKTASHFEKWRMAANADTTGRVRFDRAGKDVFKAFQFIGSPTLRVVKDEQGQAWIEVGSAIGPRWFKPEFLTIFSAANVPK